jgi:hypothetical protein
MQSWVIQIRMMKSNVQVAELTVEYDSQVHEHKMLKANREVWLIKEIVRDICLYRKQIYVKKRNAPKTTM